MKKLLGLALVLLSMVGIVAGCSDGEAGAAEDIKIGRVNYAAHGDKSFAVTVVAMQGDKIVGASIDEFQFLGEADGVVPVPNSEGAFGEGYADPAVKLASKVDSTEYYSSHMAEAAGSTVPIHENYMAIEKYVTGKTISELEDVLSDNSAEEMVDVVSGATLADTAGYVKSIIEAAKTAE